MSFKTYLQSLHYKPRTINRYLSWLQNFESFFGSIENQHKALTSNEIINYILERSAGMQRSTVVLLVGRLKRYYQYLQVEYPLEDFKIKGFNNNPKLIVLTSEHLHQIMLAYGQNKRLSLEHKVILSLLLYQGIATQELRLLHQKHLDLDQGKIHLPSHHLSERTLDLKANQILYIIKHLKDRKQGLLFDYKNDSHLKNRHEHLKQQIKLELKKQGLSIPFKNLQQLRNSNIANWINQYGILHAQYLAGHTSLASTQYHENPNAEQLRAAFTQIHPFF